MKIEIQNGIINSALVYNFDPCNARGPEIDTLKELIYQQKIVVLKGQSLQPNEFLFFSKNLGTPEIYYQPMYHHPQEKEIFVSSNIKRNGGGMGVPKTGMFWHGDYAFMAHPFAITCIYPQIIPENNRGTYFIDLEQVYDKLDKKIKSSIENTCATHSARRYFKIRPEDVYRPIEALLKEIEESTPEVTHPTVIRHPVSDKPILYISEAFTNAIYSNKGEQVDSSILKTLLEFSGQKDKTYSNPFIHLQTFEKGDLLLWDNRSLIHCARHPEKYSPAESFRITLHDNYLFHKDVEKYNPGHPQERERCSDA